jgi:hypothetical protein
MRRSTVVASYSKEVRLVATGLLLIRAAEVAERSGIHNERLKGLLAEFPTFVGRRGDR